MKKWRVVFGKGPTTKPAEDGYEEYDDYQHREPDDLLEEDQSEEDEDDDN
jgi:hypothetical protein